MLDITIANISFSYGSQVILQDINLKAQAGDFICLLGPSGCGKSTLLRLLAGLSKPTSGNIAINGTAITGPGLDRGVVFQDYSLFPWMTAGENVIMVLNQAFPGKKKGEYREIAHSYLEMVGLDDVFNKLPGQLSGGMRQRAAIARAFAINSPILLMDEPFGALDAITRAKLQDLLLTLWQQNSGARKTVVFVTHDVDEALLLSSRIIVLGLNPGRITEDIAVDIPRPRIRKELYLKKDFLELRDRLVMALNENIINRLDEDQIVQPPGEGI
ncbi:MAG: ABC transporter ATP-binding protein [Lentisphaerota bacterium]